MISIIIVFALVGAVDVASADKRPPMERYRASNGLYGEPLGCDGNPNCETMCYIYRENGEVAMSCIPFVFED